MNSETKQKIHATATVAYTEITNITQDLTLPQDQFPLAQIIETLDEHICPLCAHLHGKVIKRGTPEWEQYRFPSHINCRRTFAYIPADADQQPDFTPPPTDLIQKYGHFHANPLKYEPLKLPAFADRRQFIFRRYVDPETGERFALLQWLIDTKEAIHQYITNATLQRLFEIASIQQPLPKIRTPRNAQEFADAYNRYRQSYQSIYQSIATKLEEIKRLQQNADARTAGVLITQEFAIMNIIPKIIQREIRDLQTIFRAPRSVRKIRYKPADSYTSEQTAILETVIKDARIYIPRGYRAPTVTIKFDPTRDRSYQSQDEIILAADFLESEHEKKLSIFLHEYMHFLEEHDLRLRTEVSRIYQKQTRNEPLVPIRDLLGEAYDPSELARIDDFPHPYMGKDYGADTQGIQKATELSSMFYSLYFDKIRYIKKYRAGELHPINSQTIPQEAKEKDITLNKLFEPARLQSITIPLWRALHNLP